MRSLVLILFFVLIFGAQFFYFGKQNFFGAEINLITASVIAWAIVKKDRKFPWPIVLPVFCYDILQGSSFGLFSLSLCVVYFLLRWLEHSFLRQSSVVSVFVLLATGAFFYELSYRAFEQAAEILNLIPHRILISKFYLSSALPSSLLASFVLCLAIFLVFNLKYFLPIFNPAIQPAVKDLHR